MEGTFSGEAARLLLIRRILAQAANSSTDTIVQVGVDDLDDAALIRISELNSLVVATDFVRGSQFQLFREGYLSYFDIGYYVIMANVSDVAAMGAMPICLTTIFRYSEHLTDDQFVSVFEGIKAAADKLGVQIVGGDIGSYESDVLSATALGIVETKRALLRKNVRDDDLLCVTGVVGLPITALLYFAEARKLGFKLPADEEHRLLQSWRRPVARVKEGIMLSSNNIASACQDVSDGLRSTIESLSRASGKTFTVYAAQLPIDPATERIASFLGGSALGIAMSASVDFELLFTIARTDVEKCSHQFEELGSDFAVIGEVNSMDRNILVDHRGYETDLPGTPWDHQSGDFLGKIAKQ